MTDSIQSQLRRNREAMLRELAAKPDADQSEWRAQVWELEQMYGVCDMLKIKKAQFERNGIVVEGEALVGVLTGEEVRQILSPEFSDAVRALVPNLDVAASCERTSEKMRALAERIREQCPNTEKSR